jgi:Macrocin-O-methyltransferase (TylF)
MISFVKGLVRSRLEEAGYVVLRKSTFDRVMARNSGAQETAAPNHGLGVSPAEATKSSDDRLIEDALERAVSRIVETNLEGDVADCGIGETRDLITVLGALKACGELSRRVALFDTSMIPAHRGQRVMPLWGSWGEALLRGDGRGLPQSLAPQEEIPAPLAKTDYPATKIKFVTQITERAIDSGLNQEIALLLMTCDNHRGNSLVLSRLLPRVASGGLIVVRGYSPERADGTEPIMLLRRHFPKFQLTKISGSYWIGSASIAELKHA